MRTGKQLLSIFLIILLFSAYIPAAGADTLPPPVDLPKDGDFILRIDGGYITEHTETVNEKDCLRVDLFLDGVTSEQLLSSISMKLLYNADALTLEKYKPLSGSNAMSSFNPKETGMIQYAFVSADGIMIDSKKPLLTLWFTVAEDLPAGTLTLKLPVVQPDVIVPTVELFLK